MRMSRLERRAMFFLSALALMFAYACAGLPIMPDAHYDPVRYPGSMRASGGPLELSALYKGIFSQYGVYLTTDDSLTVWRWYADRFELEPFQRGNDMGKCMSLAKNSDQMLTRYMIRVTLCSKQRGTMIFVNQTLIVHR